MALSRRKKKRVKIIGGVAAGLFAVGVTLAVVGSALAPQPVPPISEKVAKAYAEGLANPTPQPTAASTAKPPAPLKFGPGTRTLFFGDSWTFGMTAEPVTQGFAYLTAERLKLDATVQGGPGTGYLNPGPANEGTYSKRLSSLPASLDPELVVLQGSINDGNISPIQLPDAVNKFIRQLKAKFPAAQIVMVGPAPHLFPVDPSIIRLDNYLRQVAGNNSLNYISPYAEKWITVENLAEVIDAKTAHPTNAGHAFLASKTVADLQKIK